MESAVEASKEERESPLPLGVARCILLWLLFFFFALALGYPTLNRYDPRELGPDQQVYYKVTSGELSPGDFPFSSRLLVPAIAHPFFRLAQGRVGTWNPVWFGMLVSNSLFCATFSLLLLIMGYRILRNLPLALLACALVLLDYAAPNLWLSGFVDSSEACLLMAVALLLYSNKWWPLPLIGILGGLAKQSFLPFAAVFAVAWWYYRDKSKRTYGQLAWIAGMSCTAFAMIVAAYRFVEGAVKMPWSMASEWQYGGVVANFAEAFGNQNFWYPFIWLVPLGVWRLNRFPKEWVMATGAASLCLFAILGYTGISVGAARPLFGIIAPLLSMSTAVFIAGGDPWGSGRQARGSKA